MSHLNDNEEGGDKVTVENRFSERRKTFLNCQIILSHHVGVFDAILRNLSRTGALIDVNPVQYIPKHFELRLITDDRVHDCELVWRKGARAGVVFKA